ANQVFGTSSILTIDPSYLSHVKALLSNNLSSILLPGCFLSSFDISDDKRDKKIFTRASTETVDSYLRNLLMISTINSPLIPKFIEKKLIDIIDTNILKSLFALGRALPSCSISKIFSSDVYTLPIPLSSFCDYLGRPDQNWNDIKKLTHLINIVNSLKFPMIQIPLFFDYYSDASHMINQYTKLYFNKMTPPFPLILVNELAQKCQNCCIRKVSTKFCIIMGEFIPIILRSIMNFVSVSSDQGLHVKVWVVENQSIDDHGPELYLENYAKSIINTSHFVSTSNLNTQNDSNLDEIHNHITDISSKLVEVTGPINFFFTFRTSKKPE
ncbi:hypothetical protein MXB_1568, partial [Myxobolus squamalis]